MKIRNIFSFIGFSFKSMYANKRRSISIGAGMVLGAAIFSSILKSLFIEVLKHTASAPNFSPTLEDWQITWTRWVDCHREGRRLSVPSTQKPLVI